ncbi:hypothetical protein GCM10022393_03710 [Aquimarina addita]|uniref:SGNH/GDSL hydrolase family protein n=1 Tax=Aquimarina addita TaxID=870485 RepID=A0ABP7X957_9FLAO
MKNFLKHTGVFLVPVVLVFIGVEYFYQTTVSNYSYKHEMIKKNYDQVETLILGDSHAFFGINPDYLSTKAFNISNISQSLYFDQLLFEKHVDSMPALRNVVITLGYYSLSQLENTKEDTWRKYFYHQQMELDVPMISSVDIRKYSLGLTRRFDKSLTLFQKYIENGTIIDCNADGWGTYYNKSADEDLIVQSQVTAKRHEDFLVDFEENLARLKSIIRYCEKINCKVFLVDMPVHPSYLNALNPVKLQKITLSCKTLTNEYPNTTYIDLRRDQRLENADLYDPDHLNHKGAKKYTKIINEHISTFKK